MPPTRRSIQQGQKTVGKRQPAKPGKTPRSPEGAAAAKSPPARMPAVEPLKKTIAYFYLLSYCPPGRITDWARNLAPMRKALAESAAMSEAAYFKMVTPEVCWRIVAFHQSTREPSQDWIETLMDTAGQAARGPQEASAFQQAMFKVAHLPQRAAPEGRLHRKKGCQFCQAPCSYGYFTLVSDPQFKELQDLFAAEATKPAVEQTPWKPCFRFALGHLERLTGVAEAFIDTTHLVDLSYCLLMLGIAKSRMAAPEEQLRLFQAASQEFIRGTQAENQAKLNGILN